MFKQKMLEYKKIITSESVTSHMMLRDRHGPCHIHLHIPASHCSQVPHLQNDLNHTRTKIMAMNQNIQRWVADIPPTTLYARLVYIAPKSLLAKLLKLNMKRLGKFGPFALVCQHDATHNLLFLHNSFLLHCHVWEFYWLILRMYMPFKQVGPKYVGIQVSGSPLFKVALQACSIFIVATFTTNPNPHSSSWMIGIPCIKPLDQVPLHSSTHHVTLEYAIPKNQTLGSFQTHFVDAIFIQHLHEIIWEISIAKGHQKTSMCRFLHPSLQKFTTYYATSFGTSLLGFQLRGHARKYTMAP